MSDGTFLSSCTRMFFCNWDCSPRPRDYPHWYFDRLARRHPLIVATKFCKSIFQQREIETTLDTTQILRDIIRHRMACYVLIPKPNTFLVREVNPKSTIICLNDFLISGCCASVLRSNPECREWKRLLRQSETIWYMRLFPHKQSQLLPIRIMENYHDKSGFLKTSTSSFRATCPGKERIVSLEGDAMPNHMLPRLESEVLDYLSKQESWSKRNIQQRGTAMVC